MNCTYDALNCSVSLRLLCTNCISLQSVEWNEQKVDCVSLPHLLLLLLHWCTCPVHPSITPPQWVHPWVLCTGWRGRRVIGWLISCRDTRPPITILHINAVTIQHINTITILCTYQHPHISRNQPGRHRVLSNIVPTPYGSKLDHQYQHSTTTYLKQSTKEPRVPRSQTQQNSESPVKQKIDNNFEFPYFKPWVLLHDRLLSWNLSGDMYDTIDTNDMYDTNQIETIATGQHLLHSLFLSLASPPTHPRSHFVS